MRRNSCASLWPRATANLLSVTAALALGATGCSKTNAITKLPDTSGKAVVDAEEQRQAQKREEALAGTNKKPSGSPSGRASIDPAAPKSEKRPTAPTTVDRSGLAQVGPEAAAAGTPRRPAPAARGADPLEAPDLPATARTKPAPTRPDASSSGDREGLVATRPNPIQGASWSDSATRRKAVPAAEADEAEGQFRSRADAALAQPEQSGRASIDGPAVAPRTPAGARTAATAKAPAANAWSTRDLSSEKPTRGDSPRGDAARETTVAARSAPGEELDAAKRPLANRGTDGRARIQVDRLMATSRMLLSQGDVYAAQRTALLAERVAARENVSFHADEEQPGDLVSLIGQEIQQSEQVLAGRPAKSSRSDSFGAAQETVSPEEVAQSFDEASHRFASWRSEETPRGRLDVRPTSHPQIAGRSSERRELADPAAGLATTTPGAEGETPLLPSRSPSPRTTAAARNEFPASLPGLPEPSWKSDRSPVVLSSAISAADDFQPSLPGRQVVPALEEHSGLISARSASPFETSDLVRPSVDGTKSGALNAPLLVPSLNLPGQVVEGISTQESLAVAPTGPLLPTVTAHADSGLDNVWQDELGPVGTGDGERFGKGFWLGTAGLLAAAFAVFTAARRLKSRQGT